MVPRLGLFAVCDGMGGHSHGERAAELASSALDHFVAVSAERMDVTWPFGYQFTRSADANRLETAVRLANREVWRQSQSSLSGAGMGTTIAAVLVQGDQAVIANVGDSRVYRWRDGQLELLSVDDTMVADLVSRGLMEAEDEHQHPMRNVLLQAAGAQEHIEVHLSEQSCQKNDVLLICSDGLYGVLPESTIQDALGSEQSLQQCSELLERKTLQLGGPDNVAIVLLKYTDENWL